MEKILLETGAFTEKQPGQRVPQQGVGGLGTDFFTALESLFTILSPLAATHKDLDSLRKLWEM